jgi:hypothetical protein
MYQYSKEREKLFTEQGQRTFIKVRDRVQHLLKEAGAFRAQVIVEHTSGCDNWEVMACIDRLVELEEIREVTKGQDVAGQHRVFVAR